MCEKGALAVNLHGAAICRHVTEAHQPECISASAKERFYFGHLTSKQGRPSQVGIKSSCQSTVLTVVAVVHQIFITTSHRAIAFASQSKASIT